MAIINLKMLIKRLIFILLFLIFLFGLISSLIVANYSKSISKIYKDLDPIEKNLPREIKEALVEFYEPQFFEDNNIRSLCFFKKVILSYEYKKLNLVKVCSIQLTATKYIAHALKDNSRKFGNGHSFDILLSFYLPIFFNKEETISLFAHFTFQDKDYNSGLSGACHTFFETDCDSINKSDVLRFLKYYKGNRRNWEK